MRGGLIAANLRRQVTALGLGEPADRVAAKVVEPEGVLEFEAKPLAIVGKSGAVRHLPRNEERLLSWHQPATPLIQQIGNNINAKNLHALTVHPRTLQWPRKGLGRAIWRPGETCSPCLHLSRRVEVLAPQFGTSGVPSFKVATADRRFGAAIIYDGCASRTNQADRARRSHPTALFPAQRRRQFESGASDAT